MALARDKAQEECVLLQGRMEDALSGAAQALQQLQVSKFLLQVCGEGVGVVWETTCSGLHGRCASTAAAAGLKRSCCRCVGKVWGSVGNSMPRAA